VKEEMTVCLICVNLLVLLPSSSSSPSIAPRYAYQTSRTGCVKIMSDGTEFQSGKEDFSSEQEAQWYEGRFIRRVLRSL
jgi:hypothetical protein